MEKGARIGAGATPKLLKGMPTESPLGVDAVVTNDALRLHWTKGDWKDAFTHYASLTKYGVLILAGTPENFSNWAQSKACMAEVSKIPGDRLFAYVLHDEGCQPPNQGFIINVNLPEKRASATVANGIGYTLYGSGTHPPAAHARAGGERGRGEKGTGRMEANFSPLPAAHHGASAGSRAPFLCLSAPRQFLPRLSQGRPQARPRQVRLQRWRLL